jgi:hypothetical protein
MFLFSFSLFVVSDRDIESRGATLRTA